MFRIIRWLFTGVWEIHNHEWEIIKEVKVQSYDAKYVERDIFTRYTMQCKKCGELDFVESE